MIVTFGGNPVELTGKEVKVGELAPDFTAVKNDLSPFHFSALSGKKLIVAVPSLDTPVCDLEAQRFNEEAGKIQGVTVVVVSMDLPFAQKRWCAAAGAEHVTVVSDFRDHCFAKSYGTYLTGIGLLARAVFAVDENNIVTHVEYVKEVTDHPDYDAALAAIQ